MPANREYKLGDNFLTGYGVLTLKAITSKSDGTSFYSLYNNKGIHVTNASKAALDNATKLPPYPVETESKFPKAATKHAQSILKHCAEIEKALDAMQDALAELDAYHPILEAIDKARHGNNLASIHTLSTLRHLESE